MKKKDDTTKIADQILQDQIHKEAQYLEELFGPVTYQDPEGYSEKESIQKLRFKREALKAEIEAHESAQEDDKSTASSIRYFDKEAGAEPLRVNKTSGRTRFSALMKAAVVVLVAGVCIAGVSLQSEATRMWWMESLGWNIGGNTATQVDNDKNRDYSEAPEWEVEALIEKELGIQVPKFFYMPEGMEFSDYRYETTTNQATLCYKIGEEYLIVSMLSSTDDYTSAKNFDGDVQQEEKIETSYDMVTIRGIQSGSDGNGSVIAEWDYQDVHYEIFGRVPFEEVKMMIKNMVL